MGDGVHLIQPKAVQFPAKYNHSTTARRMLPVILCCSCTVLKMEGSTVDHAVVYLGSKLFAAGQAYVALSRPFYSSASPQLPYTLSNLSNRDCGVLVR
ncbi:ATP-dependent DNA helicase [Trichonephila inaurata madagascariensis]|uniref:ATP-dependent DNA helicase n=1 Tax=Trichonephila inaurata madagascariensis TaxID=2747483 RepID=A0A8X6XWR6_9ARAC|nr:ATP-dependent DNA helicase [Trichonephila inaurata madagascariensis]